MDKFIGLPPHFDGTGFPRWKVLMEAYLQARDLNVWRVTEEGVRNKTKQEKQYDVTARSIILSSLCEDVVHRVFTCENAHELWKTIKEHNEGSEDVSNERYELLFEDLTNFKQLEDENVDSMYSRLNVLVNEINDLGVKKVTDIEIVRKML